MKPWQVFGAAAALALGQVAAQPLAIPAPPRAAITQQLGAQLPLDLPLVDAQGRQVRLGDYFHDGRPVLLVLGYYRCPQLCGLLMHGVLESLHDGPVPARDLRIVGVSIDPQDTPATARQRRDLDLAYADFLLGGQRRTEPLDLQLLTGTSADTSRLAQLAGFAYERATSQDRGDAAESADPSRYAHPAAVIVATPTGRISRYLMGIHFDPGEMRLALAEASSGRLGAFSTRIALLCAHFDPRSGRHSAAVMNVTRTFGLLLAGGLAAWCWRRRGAPPGGTR